MHYLNNKTTLENLTSMFITEVKRFVSHEEAGAKIKQLYDWHKFSDALHKDDLTYSERRDALLKTAVTEFTQFDSEQLIKGVALMPLILNLVHPFSLSENPKNIQQLIADVSASMSALLHDLNTAGKAITFTELTQKPIMFTAHERKYAAHDDVYNHLQKKWKTEAAAEKIPKLPSVTDIKPSWSALITDLIHKRPSDYTDAYQPVIALTKTLEPVEFDAFIKAIITVCKHHVPFVSHKKVNGVHDDIAYAEYKKTDEAAILIRTVALIVAITSPNLQKKKCISALSLLCTKLADAQGDSYSASYSVMDAIVLLRRLTPCVFATHVNKLLQPDSPIPTPTAPEFNI